MALQGNVSCVEMLLSPVLLFSSHLRSYTHITWFTQHSTYIISLRRQLVKGPQSPQRKVAVSSLRVNEGKTKVVKMEKDKMFPESHKYKLAVPCLVKRNKDIGVYGISAC